MKKSDLRRIIREEVINMIRGNVNEAFADPELAKLAKMKGLGGGWNRFFTNFAKTHNIAWDKLPKGTLSKSTNMNDPKVKEGLVFWMIDKEKPNPYRSDRYWDSSYTLRPGVLAVTLNCKIQYMDRGGVGPKGSGRGRSDASSAVGQAGRGMLMVKKLKEMADHLLTMDFESFRGGTTALKAKRADLKLGKDTFKDHRSWKKANLDRYKQILANRIGTRDQVDSMVAKAVKLTNAAVEEAMEVPKLGRYDQLMTTLAGNEVELRAVTYIQGQILSQYARYIQYENQEEKEKDASYGGTYYARQKKETALDIKEKVRAVETGKVRY